MLEMSVYSAYQVLSECESGCLVNVRLATWRERTCLCLCIRYKADVTYYTFEDFLRIITACHVCNHTMMYKNVHVSTALTA